MSIVHIQAESARYRVGDLDEAAREFDDIARSARAALREMRQLLGALRPDADGKQFTPQPTVADIPELVDNAAKVGTVTQFRSDIGAVSLPAITELTVYRIVQEALSNAIKHAPQANARVTIALEEPGDREQGIPMRRFNPPVGSAVVGHRGGFADVEDKVVIGYIPAELLDRRAALVAPFAWAARL